MSLEKLRGKKKKEKENVWYSPKLYKSILQNNVNSHLALLAKKEANQ